MEHGTHLAHREGNTKSSRCLPCKYWCFTLNNYSEEEMEHLEQTFREMKIKYGFGKEIGDNGTPHLQGWIESTSRIRPTEKFKNKRIHWEKTKGNREQNITYCSKQGNYKTNVLTTDEILTLLHLPNRDTLYPWQQALLPLIQTNHPRQIIWRWSKTGRTGKTTIAKYLHKTQGAILLDGKKSDILYAASEYVTKFDEDTLFYMKLIFILDFSRTTEHYVSYDALEKLKNGFWFSGKYESKMICIPEPVVIVFANFEPNYAALSEDRWNVECVDTVGATPAAVDAAGGQRGSVLDSGARLDTLPNPLLADG